MIRLEAETMSNANTKTAIRAYMAEHGVNYTTAKRVVETDAHRDTPGAPSKSGGSNGLTAAFPFGAITVAYGPDRAETFASATSHFTGPGEDRGHNIAGGSLFRHRLPVDDRPFQEVTDRVRALRRMDACDEVAFSNVDSAPEPLKVAALALELADTGSAVVVSLDVPNLDGAYEFFLQAFAASHNLSVGDAFDVLKPSQFLALDHTLLVANTERGAQAEAQFVTQNQIADRALLNAKENVNATKRRLAAFDPAYGDIVDALVKPFVRMRPATGTPKVTGSYVGGYPFVPATTPEDEVWPTDTEGFPMAFLCQVNFAEVTKAAKFPMGGYPTEGMLQWFVGGDNGTYGKTFEGPTQGVDGLHVRWYTGEDLKTRALHMPDDETPSDATIEGPLNEAGPTKMTFRAAKGLPGQIEVSEAHTPVARTVAEMVSAIDTAWDLAEAVDDPKTLAKFERLFEDTDGIWDDSDLSDPNGFGAGDKVGGYPSIVQSDPRADHPDRAQTLLVQLDSDSGFFTTWGDGGAGWLFGDPAALAKGDTSSLWWSWACH